MRRVLPGILRASVVLSVCIMSCKEEEKPAYSFKDQHLTGKIGNTSWAYEDGYAEVITSSDNSSLRIELFLAQEDDGCEVFIPEGNSVFFSVPDKTGVYLLNFDLNGSNSKTVTLYEEDEPIGVNHIAGEGAVEIQSLTSSEVKGRIDARSGTDNYINGNFTIAICN